MSPPQRKKRPLERTGHSGSPVAKTKKAGTGDRILKVVNRITENISRKLYIEPIGNIAYPSRKEHHEMGETIKELHMKSVDQKQSKEQVYFSCDGEKTGEPRPEGSNNGEKENRRPALKVPSEKVGDPEWHSLADDCSTSDAGHLREKLRRDQPLPERPHESGNARRW